MRFSPSCGLTVWALIPLAFGTAAAAQPINGSGPVRARLSADTRHHQVGRPIWVTFTIENLSDRPVTLSGPNIPAADSQGPSDALGLPLEHVFSGVGFGGLTISGPTGVTATTTEYQPPATGRGINVGPFGAVGLRLEVTQYYPVLRTPGQYRIKWEPYGGTIVSNELVLDVSPLKQAIIWTDHGTMTLRFFYEDAPTAIDNFIELAKSGFYDNLSFRRVQPGYCIMGGDPRGDGTGIRADGKKIPAEFSGRPQNRGTVNMSLLNDDPDSASCQFFIVNTRVPEWDGRYTAFAELVGDESFATLDKLMAVETDANGIPTRRVYIRSIRIVNVPADALPPAATLGG